MPALNDYRLLGKSGLRVDIADGLTATKSSRMIDHFVDRAEFNAGAARSLPFPSFREIDFPPT